MTTPTIAPPQFPWISPPPPPPPPPVAASNRNRRLAIALAAVAAAIPVLAVVWLLLNGPHTAATPLPKAFIDQAIVNINGDIPQGRIAGTGMVMTPDGLVLTNNHVVANTASLTAQLAGRGPVYRAIVVGVDPTQDVAVIQLVGASGLPVTPFDTSGLVVVGDPVTGRGNALGRNGAPVAAHGAVTSLDETIMVQDEAATIVETLDGVICFNAPIQAGDSGGPLLNVNGEVIGMDTAGSLNTATGAKATWGCAIPITRALSIATQIEAGTASPYFESGHRGVLGVTVSTTSTGVGCTVISVAPGEAASTAGITGGDVITAVATLPVTSYATFNNVMQDRRPGDTVAVTWRDAAGASHTAVAVLSAGPPA